MKKSIIIGLFALLLLPCIASAVWWKPSTWSVNKPAPVVTINKTPINSVKIVEKKSVPLKSVKAVPKTVQIKSVSTPQKKGIENYSPIAIGKTGVYISLLTDLSQQINIGISMTDDRIAEMKSLMTFIPAGSPYAQNFLDAYNSDIETSQQYKNKLLDLREKVNANLNKLNDNVDYFSKTITTSEESTKYIDTLTQSYSPYISDTNNTIGTVIKNFGSFASKRDILYRNMIEIAQSGFQTPTALCNDGTASYSQHRSGTCSSHGGVKYWW